MRKRVALQYVGPLSLFLLLHMRRRVVEMEWMEREKRGGGARKPFSRCMELAEWSALSDFVFSPIRRKSARKETQTFAQHPIWPGGEGKSGFCPPLLSPLLPLWRVWLRFLLNCPTKFYCSALLKSTWWWFSMKKRKFFREKKRRRRKTFWLKFWKSRGRLPSRWTVKVGIIFTSSSVSPIHQRKLYSFRTFFFKWRRSQKTERNFPVGSGEFV